MIMFTVVDCSDPQKMQASQLNGIPFKKATGADRKVSGPDRGFEMMKGIQSFSYLHLCFYSSDVPKCDRYIHIISLDLSESL